MKEDTSTPTSESGSSPNQFESGKPGTSARTLSEGGIEKLRSEGGVFVNAVRATRMPMVLTDPTLPGNPIVFANAAFLKLSGYSMEEVLGQQPHFMNGPDTDARDAARFREMVRSEQDEILETIQYRKNGQRFVSTVLLSAFKDDAGRTLHHFMSWLDVTRRVDAEAEVADLKTERSNARESERRLAAELEGTALLRDLSERLITEEDPVTIYEEILTAAIAIMRSDAGTVQIYDSRDHSLELLVTRNFERKMTDRFHRVDANSHTACGVALRDGRRTFVDFDADDTDEACVMLVEAGYRSAQATPLVSRAGGPLGMLNTHWREPMHRPNERQLRFLDLLARQAADVIERAQSQLRLRESEERQAFLLKLSDALRSLVDAEEIQRVAARFAGEYWGMANANYARMEDRQGISYAVVRGSYAAEGHQSVDSEYPLADFPGFTDLMQVGKNLVVPDMATDSQLTETDRASYSAMGIATMLAVPLVKNGRFVASFAVHGSKPNPWTNADVQLLEEIAERTWAAVERARAEFALRESEARLAAAFESVPAGLAVLDLNGRAIIANAEFRRFLPTGLVPSRDPDRGDRWKAWNDDGEVLASQNWPSARSLQGEYVVPGQQMLYTADDGREIWTNVATAPTCDDFGNVTGVVSVISDIDERKQAEEALRDSERHAQTLLAELQHRVRNTLAVVRSIARRTADNSGSVDEMLGHFQGRLDAFSRVQAALVRSPDQRVNLRSMIDDELVAHATREGGQVSLKGPEVALEARAAEKLNLAIHELTTNAVKHGALRDDQGRILIKWDVQESSEGSWLTFEWREYGVDKILPRFREGFGIELLTRSLPYDVQGTADLEFTPSGVTFVIRMPLSNG